ncbi:MAG: alpha/beta fold hydrolase [Akkermansiaceae bacterium]
MIHCLHGAAGSFHDWDFLQEALHTPIRAIDLWRFFDDRSPSLAEAGKMIAEQAETGDLILGYSMGGRLALHALLATPEKWRAAIIVSAHPGLTENQGARLADDRRWAELALSDWPRFLKEWNAQGILNGTLPGLHHASEEDHALVARSFLHWSLGAQGNLSPRLKEITCPILWLTGENDPKFTRLALDTTPAIPEARHTILPGCGHRLPWESPELFLDAVEKYLASLRISPRSPS